MASEAGADALGFIGVPGSVRYVSPSDYAAISSAVPLRIRRVLVVQKPEDAEAYGTKFVSIQYYEEAIDKAAYQWPPNYRTRAFRVRGPETLREIAAYAEPVAGLLLDTYHHSVLGGSGETFNWDIAREAKQLTGNAIFLAGGLTPGNVQDALDAAQPNGVDVSSGVESSPGIKDAVKVKAFIDAVKAWDFRHR